jgi:hypothetical protein
MGVNCHFVIFFVYICAAILFLWIAKMINRMKKEVFSKAPESCVVCKSSIWLPRPKCSQSDRLCTLNKNKNVSTYVKKIPSDCPLKQVKTNRRQK